jgi:BlaI family penicillinase repressor
LRRRPRNPQLTPLELEIMKVLWEAGPATVQGVQERLPGQPRLAYTTVQTMLNVLHRKGKVTRTRRNRAYQYRATVSRRKAAGLAIRDVVDRLFGGSPESLVMSLVESRQLTPERLARLTRLIEQAKNRK